MKYTENWYLLPAVAFIFHVSCSLPANSDAETRLLALHINEQTTTSNVYKSL